MKKLNVLGPLKFIVISTFSIVLFSCASGPVIDPKGVDMGAYKQDLAECKQVALQNQSGAKIAKSGLFGGLVGLASAAIGGGDTGASAATGALIGGASGALEGDKEEGQIVKKCLTNRGYTLLN